MRIYWVITALSILGVVLNIKKKRICFLIWAGTNMAWMIIDYKEGIYAQSALMGVYFLLALWGLWEWRRKR
tara:strand:- start:11231 stop:11443 length:213 start_codon:yes stop_codon:yes gene_type:complete